MLDCPEVLRTSSGVACMHPPCRHMIGEDSAYLWHLWHCQLMSPHQLLLISDATHHWWHGVSCPKHPLASVTARDTSHRPTCSIPNRAPPRSADTYHTCMRHLCHCSRCGHTATSQPCYHRSLSSQSESLKVLRTNPLENNSLEQQFRDSPRHLSSACLQHAQEGPVA